MVLMGLMTLLIVLSAIAANIEDKPWPKPQ